MHQYPTIEKILQELENKGIPESEVSRLMSSAQRFSTWIGKPTSMIACHAANIRQYIDSCTPAALGVSRKSIQNVRSDLKKLLQYGSGTTMNIRKFDDVKAGSSAWALLAQQIAGTWHREKLSRFICWCVEKGIDPFDIDEDVAEDFISYVSKYETSSQKVQNLRANIRKAWNNCLTTYPNWPGEKLSLGKRGKWWGAKREEFPVSLRNEIDQFLATKGLPNKAEQSKLKGLRNIRSCYVTAIKANIDKTTGEVSYSKVQKRLDELAPTTVRRHYYLLWEIARAAVAVGVEITSLNYIRDLLDYEVIDAFIEHHVKRCGDIPSSQRTIADSLNNIRAIAVRVQADMDEEWEISLMEMSRQLNEGQPDIVEWKLERLKQFYDQKNMVCLFSFPHKTFQRIERQSRRRKPTLSEALTVQGCLVAAILMALPERKRAVHELDIHKHIHKERRGYLIRYEKHMTKTGRARSALLSDWSADILKSYLTKYRSVLENADNSTALFPGNDPNGRKNIGKLGETASKVIEKETGLKVNMHLWRSIIALFILAQTGDQDRAKRILGHSPNSKTIEKYVEITDQWESEKLMEMIRREIEYAELGILNEQE
ncbi:tyrosine-type recombinase/integrase [Terasakiella pusilla]|uniref:tyrosine-type recombinase/integrase n=1 Tax=Terasakiella pusilla TaxID=64973 RepID=UPI003AA9B34F